MRSAGDGELADDCSVRVEQECEVTIVVPHGRLRVTPEQLYGIDALIVIATTRSDLRALAGIELDGVALEAGWADAKIAIVPNDWDGETPTGWEFERPSTLNEDTLAEALRRSA